MLLKACSSRAHFGRSNGCTEVVDLEGNATAHWKCNYCNFKLLSKQFSSVKAYIHLSGDGALRRGLITRVCEAAQTQVMSEMQQLIIAKKKTLAAKPNKQLHKHEMIGATKRTAISPKKKITLVNIVLDCTAIDVNLKLGEMSFGLDIPPI